MEEIVGMKIGLVGLFLEVVDCYLFELLGGMCKCVVLVWVLVLDFDIFFLDELIVGFDLIGVVVFDSFIFELF